MMTGLAIAIAAGCASALMFASIISGALISIVLFYLAPLPLMVAGLGWGALSAGIGGLAAALVLGGFVGFAYGAAFFITVALPAFWLARLALLGRAVPAEPPATGETVEWYPLGRILVWIAGFAMLTTAGALLTLGSDAETINAAMRRGLTRVLGMQGTTSDSADASQVVEALAMLLPSAATLTAMLTLVLNLWLAGRVTQMSGKLTRPWPEVMSTTPPPLTLAAFAIALVLCLTGGLLALLAQIAAAALGTVYALMGFATLHTLTLALKSRAIWLGFAYAAVLVFGWPVLAMACLGIADALFGFRLAYRQRRMPPPLPLS